METLIKTLNIFYLLLEIAYLISCFVVISQISKYLRNNKDEDNVLSKVTMAFVAFCILGIISHYKKIIELVGQGPFLMFIIAEVLYIWYVMTLSLRNKNLKVLFTFSLASLLITLPYLALKEYSETLYDPFFAIESLIASSISFAYFTQLGEEIKVKNVLEDKRTLIMLGLFFCYSLPFAYNTTISAINLFEPELFSRIRESYFDRFLLITISRVGTICYIILNVFFFKAFKWKTKVQTGTL